MPVLQEISGRIFFASSNIISFQGMENEENLPREPGSIDSNVAYEESQRSREDQLKSFEPVQVSSLPPVENEASI